MRKDHGFKMKKLFKSQLLLILIFLLAGLLRLWRLSEVPVSLFGDELDVGYHAYSILQSGRDYSGNFMPLHFQSLAEWRTPLYLYSSVPTVAIFGISPLGVRLPAAVFGILSIWLLYLLVKLLFNNKSIALIAAFLLTISPWHIQYSRAAFEVTEMLTFHLAGIYFFLRGLKEGRWLILSAFFLALTPWVYSTAKLYLPVTLLALIFIWRRKLLSTPRKYLIYAGMTFIIVVAPITWSTVFGGGTARFNYISVFTDPVTEPEIGFARLQDAKMRNQLVEIGAKPTFVDRIFHNKFQWWGSVLTRNYLQSFSTNFLFIKGDLNLRHSLPNIGQFYRIEAIFLLLGLFFFFTKTLDIKLKLFIAFWLFSAPIPAALTRDGGTHATRLFFFLPPLLLLISLGLYYSLRVLKKSLRKLFIFCVLLLYVTLFVFYQHDYWVHYPWNSERWWHAGFQESFQTIKEIDKDYEKVVVSTANEPPWIFFAAWSEYPLDKWHRGYPLKRVQLDGFGEVSFIDKYYFGKLEDERDIYSLSDVINTKTLYLAVASEIGANLIQQPERVPPGVDLVKAIAYPSGEPAFYLFAGRGK